MPRRNHQSGHRPPHVAYEPEVIVVDRVRDKLVWIEDHEYQATKNAGWQRANETLDKQQKARIAKHIDWTLCLVIGCTGRPALTLGSKVFGRDLEQDPANALPLCLDHLAVAWKQMQQHRGNPEVIEAVETLNRRQQEQATREAADERARWLASLDGEIYYLRQNGLIKVGWTRDLYDRLRAYGPDVELLCHYRGSRDDETNLHRQLRPALARGREWYHDGDIINLFLTRALAEHGPPYTTYDWTAPKVTAAKQRKGSRPRYRGGVAQR